MSGKLFTIGPVEMYEYTDERTLGPLPYFRTEGFSKAILECAESIKRLSGAPDDAHIFFLTCSGTGAMEAVVGGCFSGENDRFLAIDGGGFGHRFAEIAEHHGIQSETIGLEFGEALTPEMLESAANTHTEANEKKAFTGLLANLHETTTGQLYDKDMLAEFCRAKGLYFICDAIGSFLADPLDFEADGVDALIASSQKALALPPGLAIAILSDRLYKKIIEQDIRPFSVYFDFREMEANAVRGQTPFTPAIGTILALHERLEMIEIEGGAKASIAGIEALAKDFRARVAGLIENGRISLPGHPLSNACTPLVFPKKNAQAIYKRLSQEYGIWLNPSGGEYADMLLRVGHLGNLTPDDNALLVEKLSDIL